MVVIFYSFGHPKTTFASVSEMEQDLRKNCVNLLNVSSALFDTGYDIESLLLGNRTDVWYISRSLA